MNEHQEPEGFYRLPEVLRILGISKTTYYSGIKEGRYPRGHKLSARTTGYKVSDIRKLCDDLGEDS
jgi:predicted DNA-binding transcriptional regulator AlpA